MESSLAYRKIEYFTKALGIDIRLAPAEAKRGLFYYFQGKYDKVIEDFSNYVKLTSDKADAYRILSISHLKTGNYDQAVHNFDNAIELKLNMTAAFCCRAEVYRLNGKQREAILDATRAIELDGNLRTISDAYVIRSKVFRAMGQNNLAEAA
ncbi:tetratricopeptide repeat protein [Thermodesulfobacteriota bacterium]